MTRVAVLIVACLCAAPPAPAQTVATVSRMVDSLRPYVEGASGLTFLRPARFGVQSRAEVRAYIERQLAREGVDKRLRSHTIAYHLLGLLPDTVVRRRERVEVHTPMLRGYYDPETDTLYAIAGEPADALREVLSHEMVHAVQDQYIDLGALLESSEDNDAKLAAKTVIEGQATFASLRLLAGGRNIVGYTGVWREIVRFMKMDPSVHPSFKKIPLVIRENLIGPYVYGTEFMSWWQGTELADSAPFGSLMPRSTEQVLHPERYAAGDEPLHLVFADSAAGVIAEDVVGELEIHLLEAQLAGAARLDRLKPLGWGGDRFRVYDTERGPALVWYIAWDEPEMAEAFARGLGHRLAARRRAGYRSRVDTVTVAGHPITRYAFAPAEWGGWSAPPRIEVEAQATRTPD